MAARRCSHCNLNWPDVANVHSKCHRCGAQTSHMSNQEAMSDDAAKRLILELKFERYCEGETPLARSKRMERHVGLPAHVDDVTEDIVTRAVAAARKRRQEVNDLNKNWRESNG